MISVLITGASGFIGQACTRSLLKENVFVEAIGYSAENPFAKNKNLTYASVDLFDQAAVRDYFKTNKPTHLLHLAWITDQKTYLNSNTNTTWLHASNFLINEFIASGGKKVIIAGSCAEYDWSNKVCHEYNTPLSNDTIYSQSKIKLYEIATRYCENHNVDFAWGRIFYAYGPGESSIRLIGSVVDLIKSNTLLETSFGNHRRDYIYIDDISKIFCKMVCTNFSGVTNIGTGSSTSIIEIVKSTANLLKVPDEIIDKLTTKHIDTYQDFYADTNILRQELDCKSFSDLQTNIIKTIEWHLHNENKY